MPIVNIPGVGKVSFPDEMSEAEIARAIERDILPKIKVEKPEEGLGAAIKGGASRLASTIQSGLESLFDAEGAARRGLEREEEISRKYAPATSLDAVKRAFAERGLLPAAGEVASQLPGAVVEQAPQIGATLASARLGAMAGAPFGPVGAVVGGVGGAAIPSLAQLFGANIQRQAEEGRPISRSTAAAAAVPGAALEVGATFIPLGRSIVGKILGPSAEQALARGGSKIVDEGLAKVLTKGAAVGVAAEVPTEVTQQMLERLQAGLPLTTPDALAEYGEAAYGAGLVGGPFGAVGRVGQRAVARGEREKEVSELRKLEGQIAEQERLAAEKAEEERKKTPEFRQELNAQIVQLQDELRQVEPVAKDKTVAEEVRNEAKARANELKKQLKDLNEQMRASMQTAGAPTSLADVMARRAQQTQAAQIVDEFGNLITPKTKPPTEAEVAEGYERQAQSVMERDRERQAALQRLRDKEEAERQKTYEQTQQGIKTYLSQLQDIETTDMAETAKRVAAEQKRREQDVAQEMTLQRVNLVLENFGLRAAGLDAGERAEIESKINEGVINRSVASALKLKGLAGRTVLAADALPQIEERIEQISIRSRELAATPDKLMENNGQLTKAGYGFVAEEARLNELKRLRDIAQQGRETPAEQAVAPTLENLPKPPAALVESNLPTATYKNRADEAARQATGRFTDIVALVDDLRQKRVLDETGAPTQRKLASSTRQTLINETEQLRKEVVDSLITEVSNRRAEQKLKPLTRDEAIGLGIRADEVVKELIVRSAALPRGAVPKELIILEPAQMRGTEIVKAAKTAMRDPRPLQERQFGAPKRAVDVLAEMLNQIRQDAMAAGQRPITGSKPFLKKQFTAEQTDLIKDLDRVLRMDNLQPDVRNTLEQARRRIEEGGASEGLEDLVDEQVGRILRGTDRPFTLERDVTKPGGRREMGAAGTAELVDEIKTQMRFDSQTGQYAKGQQMAVVPKGAEFREVRTQAEMFPETVATERATPAMFQRMQKSAVPREMAKQREVERRAEFEKQKALRAETERKRREAVAKGRVDIERGKALAARAKREEAQQAADKKRLEAQERAVSGLGLPGKRVVAERGTAVRRKTKKEIAAEKAAGVAKPATTERVVVRRSKVVPIKTRDELDADIAEQRELELADLRSRKRLKPGQQERMLEEAYVKAKNERVQALKDLQTLQKEAQLSGKAVNKSKLIQLRNELQKKDEALKEADAQRKLLRISEKIASEEAAIPKKKAAARGAVGGEAKWYDKKFTPDQLNELSGFGVDTFSSKTYSIDDTIDFAVSEGEGGGIGQEEANQRMAEVEKKLPKNIKFKYFPTMGDVTTNILKEMSRQGIDIFTTRIRGGVQPDGTVFVIGANHTDMTDLNKTIAHEFVGHYTFEGLLGENGMKNLLGRVDKSFGSVFQLATDLGVYDDAYAAFASAKKAGLSDADGNLKALREVIAYTTEKRVDQNFLTKAKRWIQEMVGALRGALRKMGVDLDLSTSDLFYMMRQANEAFESGKPVAYKKADGTIDFASTKSKYAPGTEELGELADRIIGRQKGVIDKVKANTMGLAGRVQFVDRLAALEALVNKGVERGIIDSLKAADVMYFSRMADQRHAFVAEVANNGALKIKEVTRPDGKKEKIIESERGPSLKDISQALLGANAGNPEATGRLFTLYLAAKRAERVGIDKLNFGAGLTKADLKKALDFGDNNAAFKKARDLYNEYNRGLIEFLVKTGAMEKDKAARLLASNDYVPFYRMRGGVVDMIIGGESPIRIGDLKNQPYLQELVGGDDAIMDFFTSSLQNTTLLTDMALRNMATYQAANALKDLGIATIKPGDGTASSDTIRFKYNGEKYHAVIDVEAKRDVFGDIPSDLVVKGMEGIKIIIPGIVRGMAGPANILRKFVTRDPRYAVRQVFRDSLAAVFTTGANMTPVVDTMGQVAKMVTGKAEAQEKLQRRGVLGGQVITGAPEDMKKIMQQLASGKPGWTMAMAKLDQFAQAGDAATRMAMYNSFLKQGLSEREATLAALESMNFGRRGVSPSIYFLNATIPFFNAGVQV